VAELEMPLLLLWDVGEVEAALLSQESGQLRTQKHKAADRIGICEEHT